MNDLIFCTAIIVFGLAVIYAAVRFASYIIDTIESDKKHWYWDDDLPL